MKRVLLFGGSFDPIHNAHLKLTEEAYKTLKAEQCYFILAKNPRWKTPSSTNEQRLEMLKLALEDYPEFSISLIEYASNKEVTYTYETIMEMGNFSECEYFYLIGSDQLDLLDKWYKIDELASLVHFVVFKRFNYPINEENLKKYHCQLLNNNELDISSTQIRLLKDVNSPKKVLDYIAKNDLYYFQELKKYISEERLEHCKSVASLAFDLAKSNSINPYKAYQAGLLHDIAKGISPSNSEMMMEKYFPDEKELVGHWAYHQFLGVKIAKEKFQITDQEILDSIMFHATGSKNMSKLSKIIYCADKLDPHRGWDSTELISLCLKDIDEAFPIVLLDNIKYFRSHNTKYDNYFTMRCFAEYLKKGEY